jgi:hypothetical protein
MNGSGRSHCTASWDKTCKLENSEDKIQKATSAWEDAVGWVIGRLRPRRPNCMASAG